MINEALVREYLEEEVSRRELFLVEVSIRPVNKITVYVDSMKGVTLEECIILSRHLESKLNRDMEDFELEVSSPGLDKPLRMPQQYAKNTGRLLDVVRKDGIKFTGKLLGMDTTGIQLDIEVTEKDAVTGKKKRLFKKTEISFEEIKTAKVVISLK